MKLSTLVPSLAVAVLAALTVTSVSVAGPLLSPRLQESQTVRATGTTPDLIQRGVLTASPKVLAAQASFARHSGSETEHLNRDVSSVSPRLAANFPALAAQVRALRDGSPSGMADCQYLKPGECKKPCCKTKSSCAMPCCKS